MIYELQYWGGLLQTLYSTIFTNLQHIPKHKRYSKNLPMGWKFSLLKNSRHRLVVPCPNATNGRGVGSYCQGGITCLNWREYSLQCSRISWVEWRNLTDFHRKTFKKRLVLPCYVSIIRQYGTISIKGKVQGDTLCNTLHFICITGNFKIG